MTYFESGYSGTARGQANRLALLLFMGLFVTVLTSNLRRNLVRALIVVDVQNDFCEGGSLAVAGGSRTATAISNYIRNTLNDYDLVVATKDFHVDPGGHFSDSPDFKDSWPAHCVANTPGSEFHPEFDTAYVDAVFTKGEHAAAYSGFEAWLCDDHQDQTLAEFLVADGITRIDVCGIATDYCVKATALDGVKQQFETHLLSWLSVGVSTDTTEEAIIEMRQAGVVVD